jgi:hypothetical protein
VWLAVASLTIVVFVVGIPVYFRRVATPCEPGRCIYFHLSDQSANALEAFGLSIQLYAVYMTALVVITAFSLLALAMFIFWRQKHTRMAVFFSFMLLFLGPTFFFAMTEALVQVQPVWRWVISLLHAPGIWFFVVFGYIFPDGHFVPRWTWALAAATGVVSLSMVTSSLPSFVIPTNVVEGMRFFLFCALFAASAMAQAYRFRRVSGITERQQIKWVVFGLAAFVSVVLAILSLPFFAPSLLQPGLPNAFYYLAAGTVNVASLLVLMASIVIAILRYRLWDIDVIIRRTLQYSLFSGLLALIYFGLIVVLQSIFTAFTGQSQSPLITVLSTLAIAALFFPLRNRVQDFIDRRFYRRKYDAAKTLADFAATARDETDLDKLTMRLVEVVQETMQPESVSVWLKGASRNAVSQSRGHAQGH